MITTLKLNSLLRLENVCKVYGSKPILDGINLSVNRGEFCVVVGPSGCGKSTLLRLILGQERVTSGHILIEGKPIGYASVDRGIVYQKYSLFPHLSVLDNVLLGKNLSTGFLERYRKKKEFREEALHYLEQVGLIGHEEKYPHELSGGMQQRVAIVQSLIMRPKILLMDEPFGALDPVTRKNAQRFLLELWEDLEMTIFFVTHDLEEATFLGTRLIALSQSYFDDDNNEKNTRQGSKIVADYTLDKKADSTLLKKSEDSKVFITQIYQEMYKKTLQMWNT